MNSKEKANGSTTCIQIHKAEKQVVIIGADKQNNYTFDAVYADDST